jgi:hypothetical protein
MRTGVAMFATAVLAMAAASVARAIPISVDFGSVPINTLVTQSVSIGVDAGFSTQIASGSGINAPFGFSFDTCGAGGGFVGPGTCTIGQSFLPTGFGSRSATTNVFECPVLGGTCLPITIQVAGTGVSVAAANPPVINFGPVPINTTATETVSIAVDSGYSLQIASGSGINAPFGFAFGTCGAGGGFDGPGTCTIDQTFSPTSFASSSGTTNVFECPVLGGTCLPIGIQVAGSGVSVAAANPAIVDFGLVPLDTTVTESVSITVDTGYSVQIASGSGINAPFGFGFDTCGAGGGFDGPGTCTIDQSFLPTSIGISNGITTVFECPVVGGTCLPIGISLTGTGTTVPEPGSVALLALAALGGCLAGRGKRRSRPIARGRFPH